MAEIWVDAFATLFGQSLHALERAIRDCPESLWETDLWPEQAATGPHEIGGIWGSAPWCLAHHALLTLDYDISGDLEPWEAPPPFDDNTYGHANRVVTKEEVLKYVEYCRDRIRTIARGLTLESAARPLPSSHRYAETPYLVMLSSMALHLTEHAEQIRQFLTMSGIEPEGGFQPGS